MSLKDFELAHILFGVFFLVIIIMGISFSLGYAPNIVLDEDGYCVKGKNFCQPEYYCESGQLHAKIWKSAWGSGTNRYCQNGTIQTKALIRYILPEYLK